MHDPTWPTWPTSCPQSQLDPTTPANIAPGNLSLVSPLYVAGDAGASPSFLQANAQKS